MVAVLLAVGIATALNLIVFAVLYAALTKTSDVDGGISENATQILTGWGGGIIGILGAFVGYRLGSENGAAAPPREEVVELPAEPISEQTTPARPSS